MKRVLFVVSVCCALAGIGWYVYLLKVGPTEEQRHAEWRRHAVEPETKLRPAYFEQMKWQPGMDVEMRRPASSSRGQ